MTYDLTPYAKQGINDLLLWLGRGWYRKATFNAVHDGPLVKLQLDKIQRMALQVRYSLRIALGKAGEVCMVRPVPVLGIPINSGVNVWMGERRCQI